MTLLSESQRQTIVAALTEWQHAIFDGINIGKLDDPDATITAIDDALAAVNALASVEVVPDGEMDAIRNAWFQYLYHNPPNIDSAEQVKAAYKTLCEFQESLDEHSWQLIRTTQEAHSGN